MIHMNRILFPTDLSDTSSVALGHALMLADRFQAALTMLHAASTRANPQTTEFPEVYPAPDEFEALLAEITGAPPSHKLRLERVVHQNNNPVEEICAHADTANADLIIMGTHGRTGLSHWLAGSVTEEVVRRASCPVMAVRASKQNADVTPYFDILVPMDFSLHAQKALRYGVTLARLFEANLHLLHVVDQPLYPTYYGLGEDLLLNSNPEVPRRSHEELRRLMTSFAAPAIKCQTHVREGRAYSEIVRFVNEHECDLVVMGTHGLGGLEHFLLGGTTEKVMRHASCPVLAVKLKERDFVE